MVSEVDTNQNLPQDQKFRPVPDANLLTASIQPSWMATERLSTSTSCPIRCMPDELLVEIFQHYLDIMYYCALL
ncbi:hypothetical protein BDQ17DRAFT_1353634 [Cyathus striatus]|nr:hypothetical protein BDQ17DRAFT_1353634 [Cyathus striatus]